MAGDRDHCKGLVAPDVFHAGVWPRVKTGGLPIAAMVPEAHSAVTATPKGKSGQQDRDVMLERVNNQHQYSSTTNVAKQLPS